jgi:hypothetical protein
MGHGNHYICYKCCFILPIGYYIRSVEVSHSINIKSLYLIPASVLTCESTVHWKISIEYLVLPWLIIFVSWMCLPKYAVSDSDELQAITC